MLICCASTTTHGGSAVLNGSIEQPRRLAIVVVQHKNLNVSLKNHS